MVFDKLIHYLKIDKEEFIFQFNSHPDYPSALAFSDTLNFLGVKNNAYELEKEYWHELPEEFITIIENSFSLIKKSGSLYAVYSEKTEILSKEELYKKSSDFVLLFEKIENFENKSVFNFKPILYAVFILILIFSFLNQNLYEALFTFLSLVGVYISLEIFNQKFGQNSVVIGNICGSASVDIQTINACDKIISQDKINVLGLKFSDFSLIYFIGISVLALFLPTTAYMVTWIALLSVIAIGYSLYIQIFVEKTFCRVCLLIIFILSNQLIISTLFFQNISFTIGVWILTIILWILIFSAVLYANTLLERNKTLRKSNTKNIRFKRDYQLFKNQLLESKKIEFHDTQTFLVGKEKAKLRISIISSPYCGFCKDAHKLAENILERHTENISLQIRFNYLPEKANEKYTQLLSYFDYVYRYKSEKEFLSTIKKWFEIRYETKIYLHAEGNKTLAMERQQVLIDIAQENTAAGLTFTPIFLINGYQFPEKYDREDILFFIDELIEDEDFY